MRIDEEVQAIMTGESVFGDFNYVCRQAIDRSSQPHAEVVWDCNKEKTQIHTEVQGTDITITDHDPNSQRAKVVVKYGQNQEEFIVHYKTAIEVIQTLAWHGDMFKATDMLDNGSINENLASDIADLNDYVVNSIDTAVSKFLKITGELDDEATVKVFSQLLKPTQHIVMHGLENAGYVQTVAMLKQRFRHE